MLTAEDKPYRGLSLDIETILAINERLKALVGDQPPDSVHGSVKLTIVKGEFQLVEVTGSYRLKQPKSQRKTA